MNSREKGKRGERQWRDELRAHGFAARRGQQFAGGAESPDVVCEELAWIHFEVKAVERLNIEDAMEQARRYCGAWNLGGGTAPHPGPLPSAERERVPVVAHKRNHRRWLVTMEAETFFRLLRECEPGRGSHGGTEARSGDTWGRDGTHPSNNETTNNGKEPHEDQKQ